jgi:hypothetical protein
MTSTIGHVFVPLNREHDGAVPMDDDRAHFESLPVPLALWDPFQQCLSRHLSELTEGQIDREEKFRFEAAHVNSEGTSVEEIERRGTHSVPLRCANEPEDIAAMIV